MKVVIQRVTESSVEIEGKIHGQIGPGMMILVGIEAEDDMSDIEWLTSKIVNLRIFDDENGVMKKVEGGGGSESSSIEPLFVYETSSDSELTDKNGNVYDLETLVDAYMNNSLFLMQTTKGVTLPVKINGFSISGTLFGFYHVSAGSPVPDTNKSIYTVSDLCEYLESKYGKL